MRTCPTCKRPFPAADFAGAVCLLCALRARLTRHRCVYCEQSGDEAAMFHIPESQSGVPGRWICARCWTAPPPPIGPGRGHGRRHTTEVAR